MFCQIKNRPLESPEYILLIHFDFFFQSVSQGLPSAVMPPKQEALDSRHKSISFYLIGMVFQSILFF